MAFAFKYKNKVLLTAAKQVPNVQRKGHGRGMIMKNKKEELSNQEGFNKEGCIVLRGNIPSSVAMMSSTYGPNTIESMGIHLSGKDFS